MGGGTKSENSAQSSLWRLAGEFFQLKPGESQISQHVDRQEHPASAHREYKNESVARMNTGKARVGRNGVCPSPGKHSLFPVFVLQV